MEILDEVGNHAHTFVIIYFDMDPKRSATGGFHHNRTLSSQRNWIDSYFEHLPHVAMTLRERPHNDDRS